MKSTFLALCAVSILFFSCANDKSSDKPDTTASPVVEMAPTVPLDLGVISVPPATPPAATITTAGINPAHGLPGHRCDIAVGAPLNSAPSAPGAPSALGTPPALGRTSPILGGPRVPVSPSLPGVAPSFNTQTAGTAPGMNPAHGQPGHDCAIAVGAPLKK